MRVARYSAKYSYRRCHKPWADIGEPLKRERTTEQAEIDICLNCTADECYGNCPKVAIIGANNAQKRDLAQEQARSIEQMREIAQRMKWTHRQLAEALGYTVKGVDGWFSGYRKPMARARLNIDRLYKELGLDNGAN